MGPIAVLACLPGELHELGLIAFGLALHERGWRIVYLGADAPLETVTEVSSSSDPSLLVFSAVRVEHVERSLLRCANWPGTGAWLLGRAAARHGQPHTREILRLSGDVVAEAARLNEL